MKMLRSFAILILLLPVWSIWASAEDAADSGDTDTQVADPVTKTLVWPDGTRYVGGVVDGKRSGKGTIFWQDGTRFVGQFENDMRNGPGTMILPDGTVYTGFFRDDQLVDTESTIAASGAESSVEMNTEESLDALGDAELPMEADSLGENIEEADDSADLPDVEVAQVDEYDMIESARFDEPVSEPVDEPVDDYDTVVEEVAASEPPLEEELFTDETFEDPYSTDVTEITDAVKETLIETVNLWAAAWSDQNVPQYLANYSEDFVVPGKQSRRTWEALRRTRLTRPSYIKLDVEYQHFELVEPNVVDVFFRQTYSSNTYSDLTDKVLRMRKENDTDWMILVERSR